MTNVIKKLNVYLADLNVMYRKVQNYHWNVDGRNFFTIHAKLEEYYDEINENIDCSRCFCFAIDFWVSISFA